MIYGEPKKRRLPPVYIKARDLPALGFFELSTDEQLAKKIYEATGDKTFKGFLPLSWNTGAITKMRSIYETLKKQGKLTALNMAFQYPEVSQRAHQYFIDNVDKVKGWFDTPADILKPVKPLLWIAGLTAAAVFVSKIAPFLKKRGAE